MSKWNRYSNLFYKVLVWFGEISFFVELKKKNIIIIIIFF